MRTIAIVQARMGSTRLPGKVLKPLGRKPVLQWVVERTRAAVPDVVIATTEEEADNPIAYLGWELEIPVVRYGTGETVNDVYGRFRRVLEQYPCDAFVRVTADCPLVEPAIIHQVLSHIHRSSLFVEATCLTGFADGLDVEGIRSPMFTAVEPQTPHDREHVMPVYRQKFGSLVPAYALESYRRYPKRYRLTLDTQRDYERLQRIWAGVPHGPHGPDTLKALQWLDQHPEWWGDA